MDGPCCVGLDGIAVIDGMLFCLACDTTIFSIGDINCDYANTEGHQDIKTLFSTNGFKHVIKKPTRVTENTSTVIDVILTNSPENIIHTDVITTNLSDHEMIGAIRKK